MDRRSLLLLKYQQKTISPSEREELFEDLRTSDLAQYEAGLDKAWRTSDQEHLPTETPSDEAARRVYARLRQELPLPSHPRTRAIFRQRWIRGAAVLLVGLAAVLYWLVQPSTHLVTNVGETRTIVLPDASVVTLNGHSELRYDLPWDDQSPREVWLTGEAYFSVQHTASDQPFIVHTDLVAIQVLGTEFNVHNRNHRPEVILTSGSVLLTTERSDSVRSMTLEPGERVVLNETRVFEKSAVNPAVYAAWTKQELVLDATPLPEVALLLERKYAVPVVLSDSSLHTITLSGTYPNQQLNTVLDMLSEVLVAEASIEQSDQQVTIKKK